MKKTIQIHYTSEKNDNITTCECKTDSPFTFEEMIYGLSNVIQLFSENTGVHPIQAVTQLQNFIVEKSFEIQNDENHIESDENETDDKQNIKEEILN